MSVWSRSWPLLGIALALCVGGVAWDAIHNAALAQNPFGAARSDLATGGIVGWMLAQQAGFYRELSPAIRAATTNGSAAWKMLAISFAYGVFHAAGPGHGKAVIASYLISNGETARRGILLSFLTALLQAMVAIALVGIGAWLLNATARSLCGTEKMVEIASYLMIAAFGAWMLWIKGSSVARLLHPVPKPIPIVASRFHCVESTLASDPFCDCGHGTLHNHHEPGCGHAHGPEPQALAGRGGWRRGIAATAAAGLRPCSGAIVLLIFALAQGVFWLGVAGVFVMGLGTAVTVAAIALTTLAARNLAQRVVILRTASTAIWCRGLEVVAAAVVMLLGAGLLLGYVAAERVTCF